MLINDSYIGIGYFRSSACVQDYKEFCGVSLTRKEDIQFANEVVLRLEKPLIVFHGTNGGGYPKEHGLHSRGVRNFDKFKKSLKELIQEMSLHQLVYESIIGNGWIRNPRGNPRGDPFLPTTLSPNVALSFTGDDMEDSFAYVYIIKIPPGIDILDISHIPEKTILVPNKVESDWIIASCHKKKLTDICSAVNEELKKKRILYFYNESAIVPEYVEMILNLIRDLPDTYCREDINKLITANDLLLTKFLNNYRGIKKPYFALRGIYTQALDIPPWLYITNKFKTLWLSQSTHESKNDLEG